jgi:hypothetical protein
MAAVVESALAIYNDPACPIPKQLAIEIFTEPTAQWFSTGLQNMPNRIASTKGSNHFELVTTYASTKTIKDGRQVLSFAIKAGRYMTPEAKELAMLGADGQTVGDFLTLPFLEFIQTGTAPKGPIERSIETLLRVKH